MQHGNRKRRQPSRRRPYPLKNQLAFLGLHLLSYIDNSLVFFIMRPVWSRMHTFYMLNESVVNSQGKSARGRNYVELSVNNLDRR